MFRNRKQQSIIRWMKHVEAKKNMRERENQ